LLTYFELAKGFTQGLGDALALFIVVAFGHYEMAAMLQQSANGKHFGSINIQYQEAAV
jgi:hypothetical protein